MSRKHYVAMAATIRRHVEHACPAGRVALGAVVRDLCAELKADNRAFDRERFLTACGLTC